MVEKSIDTNGTVNNITFRIVSNPLEEVSSRAKELQDSAAKIIV
ncbi:hypothetical protein FEDK69T_15330 [Flavobacterium enshiense DK69]|nr:hypothetical protein FEDK69T_15330 [Flavobacterium enshiense DK69]